jgi:hypothetical protein
MSTGLPREDAKIAFDRERRRRVLSRLASRLRFEPDDVSHMLPFDEVVAALGATSRVDIGEQVIPLDSIVGTVDRRRGEFDRDFRPSPGTRGRWERIAEARKRGEAMPPIDVYRIGDLHFVRDGHHRVAVARAQGRDTIDARVVEVVTRVPADSSMSLEDLPLKSHERLFHERVPLPAIARERISLTDPMQYGSLAESVEAWGMRLIQHERHFLDREQVALRWLQEEYDPVIGLLREAELMGRRETETDAYLRLSCARYRIMRTQEWSDEAIERVRRER